MAKDSVLGTLVVTVQPAVVIRNKTNLTLHVSTSQSSQPWQISAGSSRACGTSCDSKTLATGSAPIRIGFTFDVATTSSPTVQINQQRTILWSDPFELPLQKGQESAPGLTADVGTTASQVLSFDKPHDEGGYTSFVAQSEMVEPGLLELVVAPATAIHNCTTLHLALRHIPPLASHLIRCIQCPPAKGPAPLPTVVAVDWADHIGAPNRIRTDAEIGSAASVRDRTRKGVLSTGSKRPFLTISVAVIGGVYEWSPPVVITDNDARVVTAIPNPNGDSIALAMSTVVRNGVLCVVIGIDPAPRLIARNLSSHMVFVTSPGGRDAFRVVPHSGRHLSDDKSTDALGVSNR